LLAAGCQPSPDEEPVRTQVWAWGTNTRGQIGDGTNTSHSTPVQLPGLEDVRSLRAGAEFTLVLRSDGSVWQWGTQGVVNWNNLLVESNSPVAVRASQPTDGSPLTDVVSIAAGADHAFARTGSGAILGWGRGDYGQLDGASAKARPIPGDPGGIIALACGPLHSMALQSGPPHLTVWMWGAGTIGVTLDKICAIGGWIVDCRKEPQQLPGLEDVIDIAAGSRHSVAVKDDGTVWTWGENDWGQLGIPAEFSAASYATPQQVWSVPGTTPYTASPLVGIRQVAAGARHNLALDSQGRVWSWGENRYGQLGQNFSNTLASPVRGPSDVDFLVDVVAIAAGESHSLAVTRDGRVYAWGHDDHLQLGIAAPESCQSIFDAAPFPCSRTPALVATWPGARQVAAGEQHSVVLVGEP
jgi:alpha-tubulin suppressor-like RCC1 family protein